MKVIVIGGSGHIGSFLVPRLVRAGHEVINISRGTHKSYGDAPEWQQVRQVIADRQQEDRDGTFGDMVAALQADVVVDLVCFTFESASLLVNRLRGRPGTCCIAARCGGTARASSCRSPRAPGRRPPRSGSTESRRTGSRGC